MIITVAYDANAHGGVSPVAGVLCPGHPRVHEAHEAAEVRVCQTRHLEAGGQMTGVGEHEAAEELGLEAHDRPRIKSPVTYPSSTLTLLTCGRGPWLRPRR